MCLAVRTIQGPPGEKKKRKGKGKGRRRSKRTGRAFFGDERSTNGGQKRTLLGGPKERKARKAGQKAMMVFRRAVFAPYQPDKGAHKDFSPKKEEKMIKKEKAKKELFLNPDCQPQKHLMEREKAPPGNQTVGLPVIGLTIPGLQTKAHTAWTVATALNLANRLTHVLHTVDLIEIGNRKIQEACMVLWHYDGIGSCSPTRRQKPAWRVALSTFQPHHHVLLRLMCLRQVMCPSCFLPLR